MSCMLCNATLILPHLAAKTAAIAARALEQHVGGLEVAVDLRQAWRAVGLWVGLFVRVCLLGLPRGRPDQVCMAQSSRLRTGTAHTTRA